MICVDAWGRLPVVLSAAAASLLVFFTGCSGDSSNAQDAFYADLRKEISADTNIYIDGLITQATLTKFSQALNDRIRTVTVRSNGGDEVAAMAIAEEVRRRKLKLVVHEMCASACAHYIFMLAVSRAVLPRSYVQFHQSAVSTYELVRRSGDGAVAATIEPTARKALELYRAAGIDTRWLLVPQLQIHTRCVSVERSFDESIGKTRFRTGYNYQWAFWIPHRELLERSGIHSEGFWPASNEQLAQSMTDGVRPVDATVFFGGPMEMPSAESIEAEFRQIGLCL